MLGANIDLCTLRQNMHTFASISLIRHRIFGCDITNSRCAELRFITSSSDGTMPLSSTPFLQELFSCASLSCPCAAHSCMQAVAKEQSENASQDIFKIKNNDRLRDDMDSPPCIGLGRGVRGQRQKCFCQTSL